MDGLTKDILKDGAKLIFWIWLLVTQLHILFFGFDGLIKMYSMYFPN